MKVEKSRKTEIAFSCETCSNNCFNPLSAKIAKLRQDVILNKIECSSLYGVISHLCSLPLDGRYVVLRF